MFIKKTLFKKETLILIQPLMYALTAHLTPAFKFTMRWILSFFNQANLNHFLMAS